jgi:hypothetical protein
MTFISAPKKLVVVTSQIEKPYLRLTWVTMWLVASIGRPIIQTAPAYCCRSSSKKWGALFY